MASDKMRRSSPVKLRHTTVLASATDRTSTAPNVLGQLSADTLQAVHELGRRREYANGDFLFRQGERHDGVSLIEDGVVRSFYVSEDGKELTLGFWTTGHYVGTPQMFGGGQHAWNSLAVAPTRCLWLPGLQLRALSTRRPDLALALIDALVHKSQCYCALLQLLATHSMRVRLARLLAMLSAREDGNNSGLSHGQLASMIGSTRQWVSLTLTRFEEDGLLRKNHDGSIEILQPDQLNSLR